MDRKALFAALFAAGLIAASGAGATIVESYASLLGPAPAIDFEGLADGTLVSNQYAKSPYWYGVTFSQTGGGSPMINTYPWLFGYGSSSGVNVLTGSTQGGNPYPTVAGITAAFRSPRKAVEVFLSDTSPLGEYAITVFGKGGSVLETATVAGSSILPPGYGGGVFPPPGTYPLPGVFIVASAFANDIYAIQIGPGSAPGDSFAIDDLRFVQETPEPATWALMTIGLGGVGAALRSRRRLAPAA